MHILYVMSFNFAAAGAWTFLHEDEERLLVISQDKKHTLHTLRLYSQVNISRQLSWIHTTKQ